MSAAEVDPLPIMRAMLDRTPNVVVTDAMQEPTLSVDRCAACGGEFEMMESRLFVGAPEGWAIKPAPWGPLHSRCQQWPAEYQDALKRVLASHTTQAGAPVAGVGEDTARLEHLQSIVDRTDADDSIETSEGDAYFVWFDWPLSAGRDIREAIDAARGAK